MKNMDKVTILMDLHSIDGDVLIFKITDKYIISNFIKSFEEKKVFTGHHTRKEHDIDQNDQMISEKTCRLKFEGQVGSII